MAARDAPRLIPIYACNVVNYTSTYSNTMLQMPDLDYPGWFTKGVSRPFVAGKSFLYLRKLAAFKQQLTREKVQAPIKSRELPHFPPSVGWLWLQEYLDMDCRVRASFFSWLAPCLPIEYRLLAQQSIIRYRYPFNTSRVCVIFLPLLSRDWFSLLPGFCCSSYQPDDITSQVSLKTMLMLI